MLAEVLPGRNSSSQSSSRLPHNPWQKKYNFSAYLYIYKEEKAPASKSFDLNLRELSHTLRTKLNAHSSYPIKQHPDFPVQ